MSTRVDELAGRRILVTGAAGFLGSNLVRVLSDRGLRCRGLVRASSPKEILAPWAAAVDLVEGDLHDPAVALAACADIDLCLHAAGTNDMGKTQAEMREILVPTTTNLLAACRRQGVAKVVVISSCETLGVSSSPERLLDETAPYDPRHAELLFAAPYHEVEQAVAREVAAGLDVSLINLLYVMAPGDRGQLFDQILAMGRFAFALAGGFSLSHVDDVVAALLAAGQHGRPGERYMLAGENVTYREFTRRLRARVGKRGPVVTIPRAVARIAARLPGVTRTMREVLLYAGNYLYYDCTKAERELGYRAATLDRVIDDVLQGTPRTEPRAHRK